MQHIIPPRPRPRTSVLGPAVGSLMDCAALEAIVSRICGRDPLCYGVSALCEVVPWPAALLAMRPRRAMKYG